MVGRSRSTGRMSSRWPTGGWRSFKGRAMAATSSPASHAPTAASPNAQRQPSRSLAMPANRKDRPAPMPKVAV